MGQSLKSRIEQWQTEGKELPKEVTEAATKVDQRTATLSLLNNSRSQMPVVDRGTDSFLAGYYTLIEGFSRLNPELTQAPVPAPLLSRVNAAAALLQAYFPKGVSPIIHVPYDTQWALLDAIKAAFSTPEHQARINILGIQQETQYLFQLIDVYGAHLGITKSEGTQADPVAQASVSWHDAFGAFYIEITRAFPDGQSTEHTATRDFFLEPYHKRTERERLKAQSSRTPTDEDTDVEAL